MAHTLRTRPKAEALLAENEWRGLTSELIEALALPSLALGSPHHAEDQHNPSSTQWPTVRPRSPTSRGSPSRRTNCPLTKKAPAAGASAKRPNKHGCGFPALISWKWPRQTSRDPFSGTAPVPPWFVAPAVGRSKGSRPASYRPATPTGPGPPWLGSTPGNSAPCQPRPATGRRRVNIPCGYRGVVIGASCRGMPRPGSDGLHRR